MKISTNKRIELKTLMFGYFIFDKLKFRMRTISINMMNKNNDRKEKTEQKIIINGGKSPNQIGGSSNSSVADNIIMCDIRSQREWDTHKAKVRFEWVYFYIRPNSMRLTKSTKGRSEQVTGQLFLSTQLITHIVRWFGWHKCTFIRPYQSGTQNWKRWHRRNFGVYWGRSLRTNISCLSTAQYVCTSVIA